MFGESGVQVEQIATIDILPDAYKIIALSPEDKLRAGVKETLLKAISRHLPDSLAAYLRVIPYMPSAVLMPAGCFSSDLIYSAYMQVRRILESNSDFQLGPYTAVQSNRMRQQAYEGLRDRIPNEYRRGIEDRLTDKLQLVELSPPTPMANIWRPNGLNPHETIVLLEHVYADQPMVQAAYAQLFTAIDNRLQERDFNSEQPISEIIKAINNFY